MKINLITIEQKNSIVEIYNSTPILTLQNKGYEYIGKNNLTDEDKEKIKEVESILKTSICGFSSFTNFRLDKNDELQIRLQYNYGAEDGDAYFIGVGYILVDELLNGFRK